MKQTRIAYGLKGFTILLALIGILFFSAITWYAFYMKNENPDNLLWTIVFFSWFAAACCYVILANFWMVCTQIGRDRSFSKENATAFHRMMICGVMLAIGFLVRMVYLFFLEQAPIYFFILGIVELFFSIFFAFLCEALSQLVMHAYEVKKENELTI